MQLSRLEEELLELIGFIEIRNIAIALPEVEEGPPVQAAR
jgi:hypothetical protein